MAERAEVEAVLALTWTDPGDYWDGERYRLGVETEYDDDGDLISEDVVQTLLRDLPVGWTARWTGTGSGAEEDLEVVRG